MNNLFTKNKVKKLPGKGWFTRPLLVLKTKSKKSRLVGKVLKKYKGTMTAKEGVRLKRMINSYLNCFLIANIPVLETRSVLVPTKNGKYRLFQVQPPVPNELVLSNYLTTCSKEQAIDVFKQMKQIIQKIENFNTTHQEKIGMDPKPSNFAMQNGKVTLIDLYPPQIKGKDELKADDLLKHLRNKPITRASLLLKRLTREVINQKIEKHYETDFLKGKMLWHFSSKWPELTEQFRELMK